MLRILFEKSPILGLFAIVTLVLISGVFDRVCLGRKRFTIQTWVVGLVALPLAIIGTAIIGPARWPLAIIVFILGFSILMALNEGNSR